MVDNLINAFLATWHDPWPIGACSPTEFMNDISCSFLCLNWLNFDCPVVQSYLSPYCFEVMMNFKRTLNLSFSRCWKCYIWPPRPLTWPALPLEKAFPCYFKSGYLLLVRDMSGIYVWIWVATIRLVFYLVHIFNLIYIDRHILFFL